jgi:hypothetical protein
MDSVKNAEMSFMSILSGNVNVGRTRVSVSLDLTSKYIRNGNKPELFIANPHK